MTVCESRAGEPRGGLREVRSLSRLSMDFTRSPPHPLFPPLSFSPPLPGASVAAPLRASLIAGHFLIGILIHNKNDSSVSVKPLLYNEQYISKSCFLFFVIDRYKFDSYSLIKEGTDSMPSLVIQMTKNLFSLQRLGFIYFSSIFFFTRHFRSQGIKGRMFWVYRLVIE